ncbi:hypothetical protein [Bradyrhizobium sp. STM 3561]|uniref:hypothetical protein n=1 Tax=Bradyrhizobium sp. STM 3561 TaxID=578923 RepID=UPI00388FD333
MDSSQRDRLAEVVATVWPAHVQAIKGSMTLETLIEAESTGQEKTLFKQTKHGDSFDWIASAEILLVGIKVSRSLIELYYFIKEKQGAAPSPEALKEEYSKTSPGELENKVIQRDLGQVVKAISDSIGLLN